VSSRSLWLLLLLLLLTADDANYTPNNNHTGAHTNTLYMRAGRSA